MINYETSHRAQNISHSVDPLSRWFLALKLFGNIVCSAYDAGAG
jgi:hypothetical protein